MKELLILLFTLFAAVYCSEYIANMHWTGGSLSMNDFSYTCLTIDQSIARINILDSLLIENKTKTVIRIIAKGAENSFHFIKSFNIYSGIKPDGIINNGTYNPISGTGIYALQMHNEIKLI